MPQYMLLIYTPVDGPPSAEKEADMSAWMEFTQGLQDAGVLVHSAPLQDVDSATTVRVRGGETQVIDGPFAETKEFLGGYYLLDCPDLDAALRYAARVPNIRYGSTEVRPIMALPGDGAEAPASGAAATA